MSALSIFAVVITIVLGPQIKANMELAGNDGSFVSNLETKLNDVFGSFGKIVEILHSSPKELMPTVVHDGLNMGNGNIERAASNFAIWAKNERLLYDVSTTKNEIILVCDKICGYPTPHFRSGCRARVSPNNPYPQSMNIPGLVSNQCGFGMMHEHIGPLDDTGIQRLLFANATKTIVNQAITKVAKPVAAAAVSFG